MDTEIRHRLEDLVRAIRSSEEYRQFEEAKEHLNAEPGHDFSGSEEDVRIQAAELYVSELGGGPVGAGAGCDVP